MPLQVTKSLTEEDLQKVATGLRVHYGFGSPDELESVLGRGNGVVYGHTRDGLPASFKFVVWTTADDGKVHIYRCATYYNAKLPSTAVREFQRHDVETAENGDQLCINVPKLLFYFSQRRGSMVFLEMMTDAHQVDVDRMVATAEFHLKEG